jgi:pimeloyl-ACP methyl ester carboxylesterase
VAFHARNRRVTDPSVLIIGGFPTNPLNYIALRRRLLRRGAARVDIAPLWTPDWLLAGIVGFEPVTRRATRAIRATYRAAGAKPIIVIAHSGGGVVARLAMSERPWAAW